MNHKELVYAANSSFHLPYASKEWYEIFQQQLIPFLIVYHLIFCAERLAKIRYFVCTLRVHLGRSNMVWTKWSSWMISEGCLNIFMYPRKVMKQFSSNGCLFVQHNTPFPMLRGYPKSCILYAILESTLAELTQCEPRGGDRWNQ